MADKGCPVAIEDDGFNWGSMETWPTFLPIRITQVTKAQVIKYMDHLLDTTVTDPVAVLKERQWFLPPDVIDSLITANDPQPGEWIEIRRNKFRTMIRKWERDADTVIIVVGDN